MMFKFCLHFDGNEFFLKYGVSVTECVWLNVWIKLRRTEYNTGFGQTENLYFAFKLTLMLPDLIHTILSNFTATVNSVGEKD